MKPAKQRLSRIVDRAKSENRALRALSFIGPAAVVHWPSRGRSLAHHRQRPANSNHVQPFGPSRVMSHLQRRMAVVGNGIIDVGSQTPSRNPSQPTAEPLAQSDGSSELRIDKPLQTGTTSLCGAMPLQGGDSSRQRIGAARIRALGRLPRSQRSARAVGPAAAGPDKAVGSGTLCSDH